MWSGARTKSGRRRAPPSSSGSSQMWKVKSGDLVAQLAANAVPDVVEVRAQAGRPLLGATGGRLSEEGGAAGPPPRPRRGASLHAARAAVGPSASRRRLANRGKARPQAVGTARRRTCDGPPGPTGSPVRYTPPRLTDEAHLSAQEAQARPHPRVPRPHAHAGRPARAQAPPRQGPQAAHALAMAAPARAGEPRASAPAVAQRRVRSRLPRGPLARAAATSSSTPSRARRRRGRAPARHLGRPQGRRRGRAQPGQAAAARGVLGRRPTSFPAGHDFVSSPARTRASWPSEGATQGIARGARASCSPRPGLGGRTSGVTALRVDRRRAGRFYQRVISPALPAALQVPSDLLAVRRAGDPQLRHTARPRPRRLAAAALQPLEPRRRRLRRGPDALPRAPPEPDTRSTIITANILQPLIDVCRGDPEVLATTCVGRGSWGLAIILLTFTVRLVILPLTFK